MTPDEQRDAIRKMMASRRRQLRDTSAGSYPKWKPGMTTRAYLGLYGIGHPNMLPFGPMVLHPNHGKVVDLSRFDRPAPWIEGPEVIDESEIEDLAA